MKPASRRAFAAAAPAVPIRGIQHFAYRCRDGEQTRRFYEDLLGLPLVHTIEVEHTAGTGDRGRSVQLFFAMADGSCIAFFEFADDDVAAPVVPDTRRWVSHLALRVDSVEALRAAESRLRSAGVQVFEAIDRDPGRSIYCFDPNDIRVELTTPMGSVLELAELATQARRGLEHWMARKSARAAALECATDACTHASEDHRRSEDHQRTGEVSMGSPSPELSNLWLARAFNAQDVDAAAALYHPDASVARLDDVHGGTRIARGAEAIRATMAAYVDLEPHMDVVTHHTTVAGDFAMTRSQWLITGVDRDGNPVEVHHHGMEVHRRGADGTWYFFIDHPFGADPSWAIPRPPPTE